MDWSYQKDIDFLRTGFEAIGRAGLSDQQISHAYAEYSEEAYAASWIVIYYELSDPADLASKVAPYLGDDPGVDDELPPVIQPPVVETLHFVRREKYDVLRTLAAEIAESLARCVAENVDTPGDVVRQDGFVFVCYRDHADSEPEG